MLRPDECRGPVDVGRLVKRYRHTNPRMQTGSPPVWLEPVSDFVLFVVCVVFRFSSRPQRAGVTMLKYVLCIVLLFIFASFLLLTPLISLSSQAKSGHRSPMHRAVCRC